MKTYETQRMLITEWFSYGANIKMGKEGWQLVAVDEHHVYLQRETTQPKHGLAARVALPR